MIIMIIRIIISQNPTLEKKSLNSEGKNQKKSPQPKIAKGFFF